MKFQNNFYFFFVFLTVFFSSCGENAGNYKRLANSVTIDSALWYDSAYAMSFYRLDTFFTNRLEHREFNGNVLIALHGRVIYSKTFGYKTPWDSIPLSMNDAFQLASITKPFTATAVLQLCRAGKLSLDDTLTKHIPSFPYPDITIKHLL
ncbi:MAG: serine hydrolase domain-containing protein [Flavobacteriales bacterium]